MMAFYLLFKWIHITAVLLSGAIFLWRGVLVQAGRSSLAMAAPVRYTSYGVDTVLLSAALALLAILPGAMFANGWLLSKLAVLVVYVGVATFALKRGRTPRIRTICFGLALLAYVTIISIAYTHQPLGWLIWIR